MKKIIPIFLVLASQQAFACLSVGNNIDICVGDTVFKGSSYSQGATVVSENFYNQQVTVRSNYSGSLNVENVRDLDVINACLGQFCTGDKVLKGTSYSQGANVIAINFSNQTLTLKSIYSGSLGVERAEDLDSTTGCLESVCIGDKIFKGTSYSQGATIAGINYFRRTLTVKSVYSGNLGVENLVDVDLTTGCLGNICVNDVVFKGTAYSQGATVLALNHANFTATVKSNYSGNLNVESVYDLESTTRGRQDPRDPRDPRNPREPRNPRDPRDPRNPRQATEQCTVDRLDPAGMFITSYTRSVTGFPDQNLKAEACKIAISACESELKGRQTCNITR